MTAESDLTLVAASVVSIELTAPVDGQFTISSQAKVAHSGPNGSDVICKILESIKDFGSKFPDAPLIQWYEKEDVSDIGTLNGTGIVDIAAGETCTFNLSCRERISDGGTIHCRSLAAIFTPGNLD